MAWSLSFDKFLEKTPDDEIVLEAQKRFKQCEDWEAYARRNFNYDYKFANADSSNMYQWDNWVVGDRVSAGRPCLTINKTMQHNLQILNDTKQNKSGVKIIPVGDEASFEAAQIFQEVIRHIEYVSNAENVYDYAAKYQIDAGWGYWRICVEPINPKSFDQDIKIKKVKDPRNVYLDFNCNEDDRSDARFGFIFDDMPRDLYEAEYPDHKDVGTQTIFNEVNYSRSWFTDKYVRVCEYFRMVQKPDTAVQFTMPHTGNTINELLSDLPKETKEIYKEIKQREGNLPPEERTYRERDTVKNNIEWYKIAGNKIIDRKPWLGNTVPIIPLMGTETVIDGIWDCKGHTRALLDPQRIYNINSSANVEFGALQSKSPYVAPAAAIEGYEEYWKTANTANHSILPFNHVDEDGTPVPPPQRSPAPQSSPAYVEQLKISQEEMMMVTGQFQAQMGENENAKSGVAINSRQRQGDRATYHFIDNHAKAIRRTGKDLIYLIPKIFDTKRVKRIEARDGTVMNVTIDPNAPQAMQKLAPPQNQMPPTDNTQQIIEVIFNPNVGMYDVQSDVGPSYATRRQEAFNALTQIAAQNKEFMNIAGDILWKVADFPEAQVLAQRWRKIIPPNVTGDAPNPQTEQLMHQASDHIQQLTAQLADLAKQVKDKEEDQRIKRLQLDLELKKETAQQARLDYEAETKRVVALGNSGPAISVEQIQPVLRQLLSGMVANGEVIMNAPGPHQGGTPITLPALSNGQQMPTQQGGSNVQLGGDSLPDVPGSRQAPNGQHYVQNANGEWLEVEPESGSDVPQAQSAPLPQPGETEPAKPEKMKAEKAPAPQPIELTLNLNMTNPETKKTNRTVKMIKDELGNLTAHISEDEIEDKKTKEVKKKDDK